MTNSLPKLAALLLALTLLAAWPAAAYAELQPYSARYSVYRNGKLIGMAELEVRQEGESWAIASEVSGTHGLARLIQARDEERVIGRVQDGRFRPDRYERDTRHLGMRDEWLATFDWDRQSVSVVHDNNQFELQHGGRVLDPLSLKLEMRRRLRAGGPDPDSHDLDLNFMMLEEDEIEAQSFRILRNERLETSLGCLDTLPVEKIRENSTRFTRAWHAPELDYIAVRLEHGKVGGNQMEMRISELTLNGAAVQPSAGCAAMQSTRADTSSH
ncbi:MAG: DUF3108 domain-containing protein [Xanthomonadales bacterium]|nr:DUF3108 domain-containing protein [Xanthomonadales bacterium]